MGLRWGFEPYMLEGRKNLYYPYLTLKHQTHRPIAVVGLHSITRQVVGSSPRSAHIFLQNKIHPPCAVRSWAGPFHPPYAVMYGLAHSVEDNVSSENNQWKKNIGPISRYSKSIW
jgi:hypothetical protein